MGDLESLHFDNVKVYMKANAHTLSWCSNLKEILIAPQINWAITCSEKTDRAPTMCQGWWDNSIWAQQVDEKEWDRFPMPDHQIYHLMYNPKKWFRNTEGKGALLSPVQNVLKGLCYPSLLFAYERRLEDNFWSSNSFCPNKQLMICCQVKHGL